MSEREIYKEFEGFLVTSEEQEAINEMRVKFDQVLDYVLTQVRPNNRRYSAIVATKLEEACMFAIKGIVLK